jgi:hypothetical protein
MSPTTAQRAPMPIPVPVSAGTSLPMSGSSLAPPPRPLRAVAMRHRGPPQGSPVERMAALRVGVASFLLFCECSRPYRVGQGKRADLLGKALWV